MVYIPFGGGGGFNPARHTVDDGFRVSLGLRLGTSLFPQLRPAARVGHLWPWPRPLKLHCQAPFFLGQLRGYQK